MLFHEELSTISMADLYNTVYEASPPVIEGLIYSRNLYLLVGAPKTGKSFLVSQIAYAVAKGTPLWDSAVRQGDVLYLALEDTCQRLQGRFYRMFGIDNTEHLHFSTSASKMDKGLVEQLESFLQSHPRTCLVIIDTLQKIRDTIGEYSYAADYEVVSKLKGLSDCYGICILLVHHTRKQAASDVFDMISGTSGLLGSADGAFIFQKETRVSNNATLQVSGRDQQDEILHLRKNSATLQWELVKKETDLWVEPPEPLLEAVSKFITAENTAWEGTPTELLTILGLDMNANTMSTKLNVNVSRLASDYHIRYRNMRTHQGRRIYLDWIETETDDAPG